MKKLVAGLLCFGLVGCGMGDILVKIPNQEFQNQNLLAQVKVNDLRDPGLAYSSREAAFGQPMGNISFDPSEPELVQNFLEAELNKTLSEKGVQSHQNYVCDIIEFRIYTKATLAYWDVIGHVHLILKHEGKEYDLSGTNTIRTFIWPSEGILTKVVEESLKQVATDMRQVL